MLTYVALLLILILSGYLRIEAYKHTVIDIPLRSDAGQYAAYAYNMKYHGIYSSNKLSVNNQEIIPAPDAVRPPLYPLFLYLVSLDSNLGQLAERVSFIQTILGILVVILAGYIAHITMGRVATIIVSLLCAISPHIINMGIYVLSETLFLALLLLFISVTISAQKHMSHYLWAIATMLLAFSALTRPTIQYFIVFLIPFVWLYTPHNKRFKYIIIMLVVYSSIVSVWLLRNKIATGEFSDPKLAISTLHHGMYPGFMLNDDPDTYPYPYKSDPHSAKISSTVDGVAREIFRRFSENPMKMLGWYISKPVYLFQWRNVQAENEIFIYPALASPYYLDSGIFPASLTLMKHIHPTIVWLSFFGMLLCLINKIPNSVPVITSQSLTLISALYAYFILIHLVGAPFPRYSIPIRPLTYILATVPFYLLWHKTSIWLKSNHVN